MQRAAAITTTCIVNNFNYAQFVGAAVDSALAQTAPFDQVVIVDDGSTDNSLEQLYGRFGQHAAVEIVAKENQGQLSCFNEGFARATGDVVFFLDSDDLYESTYAHRVLEVYRRDAQVDFVYCSHRWIGRREGLRRDFARDRDLGYSVMRAAYLHSWIGAPTSCLSMRRQVLEKILPLPNLDDWRTRADDCLVYGSSLVAARKYFLTDPLVNYRMHGANQFAGRAANRAASYRHRLAINRLFAHLQQKLGYDLRTLADFHHREFCTIPAPVFRELAEYVRINRYAQTSLVRRMACLAVMVGNYLRSLARLSRRHRPTASPSEKEVSSQPLRVFDPAIAPAQNPAAQSAPLVRASG